MTATATDADLDPESRQPWAAGWYWPLLVTAACLLGGCAEQPLPERAISRDDCLRELSLDTLEQRLQDCDAVVAAFPRDPAPLNDRYLLHSLAGNDQAACADLLKAIALARSIPAEKLDEQLRIDLEVREQLCNSKPNPSAATQP